MIGVLRRIKHALRMPIAILVFRIPENDDEFKDAVNGWKWHVLAQDMDQTLRSRVHHGDERGSYQEARDLLYELMHDYGLDLWD